MLFRQAIRLLLTLLLLACAAREAAALPGADGAPPASAAAPAPLPEPMEAAPAPESPAPDVSAAQQPSPSRGPVSNEQLEAEVTALHEEMRMLQSTLDLMVNKIMADLREENEQLRMEIRRLNTLHGSQGIADFNAVPRPAGSVVDQVLSEPEPEPDLPPPPPFRFSVVREWGRTAEEAKTLGGDAQSLKGLIGVVPAGSRRDDIEKLARDLRGKYDNFDNINIEVFDDPVVAQAFAASRPADPEHRVLSVSRHKESGRDAIVLLTNGKGEMISADPNAPPPPRVPDDLPTLSVTNPVAPGQAKRPPAEKAEASPAASEREAGAAPAEEPKPGEWQKTGRKEQAVKGSSKKRAEEEKEQVLRENEMPIPEGVPPMVPHEGAPLGAGTTVDENAPPVLVPRSPAQPEVKVYEAPPGEPAPHLQDTAPPDTPATGPDDVKEAAPEAAPEEKAAAQEQSPVGPKTNFGHRSRKKDGK